MGRKPAFKGVKEKTITRWSIPLTLKQIIKVRKSGLTPELVRRFIDEYDKNALGLSNEIHSSDWRRLKDILIKVPSLQLIGDVGAGKTFLTRELVKNDKDHIYIVLDSHNGYDFLPKIHQISPVIKESSVLEMNKMDDAAGLSFKMYKSLIQYDTYPKHFILVVDEALRYKNHGIVNLLAESRKFLKVLAIMQEKIVDFVPEVHVKNYNKVEI